MRSRMTMRQSMFELEGDPVFAFVDPKIAAVLSGANAEQKGLFSDLLFYKGEEGDVSGADEMFDA